MRGFNFSCHDSCFVFYRKGTSSKKRDSDAGTQRVFSLPFLRGGSSYGTGGDVFKSNGEGGTLLLAGLYFGYRGVGDYGAVHLHGLSRLWPWVRVGRGACRTRRDDRQRGRGDSAPGGQKISWRPVRDEQKKTPEAVARDGGGMIQHDEV